MIPRWLLSTLLAGLLVAATACNTRPALVEIKNEETPGNPLFEDITSGSGVDFTYRNGEETADNRSILESLGGGVALLDYDGDGLLDIFLPGGGVYAGADGKDIVGLPGKLY